MAVGGGGGGLSTLSRSASGVAARLQTAAAAGALAARAAGPSGLFVLLSTASYLLPLMEARQRRSPFYAFLFLSLLALAFLTHCEDLGLCAPLADATLARLHSLNRGATYFLLLCIELVVFEVRGEAVARAVCGAWALLVWLVDPQGSAVAANVAASLLLTGGLFLFELRALQRRIAWPPYLTRLGVIAAIAAGGFALFSLLHRAMLWHGVWHVYNAGACFVLLLAQRRKQENSLARRARGGGGGGGGGGGEAATPARRAASYGSNGSGPAGSGGDGGGGSGGGGGGGGGSTTIDGGLTTPIKRGDGGAGGAVAPRVAGEGEGGLGGAAPAYSPVSTLQQQQWPNLHPV
jgi:hypothetical protein